MAIAGPDAEASPSTDRQHIREILTIESQPASLPPGAAMPQHGIHRERPVSESRPVP